MTGIKYRPSIDGLRSIAVSSVLLFHLDESLLPGGFIGVDIFFVISGYLLTLIILRECASGTFSLLRFYQRRISRVFPLFFTVMLSTLAAASLFYTEQDLASAGALSTASALSLTNLKLLFQGNYFELSPDSQPFLHYWSLSVEEQFYLILPVSLLAATNSGASPRQLVKLLLAGALASYACCIALTASKPIWAFYLLPTRAWELLAGAALAGITPTNPTSSNSLDRWLSLAGLPLIAASFFIINKSSSFPGSIALLPVLGTVFLIGRSHDSKQLTERILSQKALVYIGKLSFSLYLWHWPVYSFIDYTLYAESTPLRFATKIILTITLSLTSFVLLEKPIRAYLNHPSRQRLAFIFFASGVLAFAFAGRSIRFSNYLSAPASTVATGGLHSYVSANAPNVVLMGDSNGSMYGTVMKEISAKARINVNIISVSADNPFPPSKLFGASIEYIATAKPEVTIFVAAWSTKIENDREKLDAALSEMLKHTADIILITQPPLLPDRASRESFRVEGPAEVSEDMEAASSRIATNTFLKSRENERVHVLDIEHIFLQPNGRIRLLDDAGRQLFQDKTHLSGSGARLVGDLLIMKLTDILRSRTVSAHRNHF